MGDTFWWEKFSIHLQANATYKLVGLQIANRENNYLL